MTDERSLVIGANGEERISIDLDALLGQHAMIISNSGGGKSGLIRKINEVTNGLIQQIILDPEDDFYTLREKHDFVIAGGEEGDVPATLANARELALATLTHGFNLIVQLNDLGEDAGKFVSRFIEGLMSAPRELWHPVLITIDELQRFASRDAGEATPAIKDLVFRGRKRGFTALFASLRMAEIDPGIRGMVNNWMLGRNGQALDRRTMAEQIGFTAKEGRERLSHIAARHFWGIGPAISLDPMMFKVLDVETTPVRAGQDRVATPPPPEALRGILDSLKVEVPAAKGNSSGGKLIVTEIQNDEISALRQRIRDAESERDEAQKDAQHWQGLSIARKGQIDRIMQIVAEKLIGEDEKMEEVVISYYPPVAMPPPIMKPGPLPAPPEPKRSTAIPEGIPARWQKILDAIAWGELLLGLEAVDRSIIGWAAGKSPKSGGFQNDMGAMRSRGLITYPREGSAALTDEGRAFANFPARPPSKADLYAAVKSSLDPRHQQILDAVREYRRASRETIAAHLGKSEKGGGFQNDLGRLRTLGLIDYPEPGYVELGRVLL